MSLKTTKKKGGRVMNHRVPIISANNLNREVVVSFSRIYFSRICLDTRWKGKKKKKKKKIDVECWISQETSRVTGSRCHFSRFIAAVALQPSSCSRRRRRSHAANMALSNIFGTFGEKKMGLEEKERGKERQTHLTDEIKHIHSRSPSVRSNNNNNNKKQKESKPRDHSTCVEAHDLCIYLNIIIIDTRSINGGPRARRI
ncbi:hypothetical protein OUZ56_027639 [Daphnia magna]|uniref:Uncharacterized protein n=1 Tax=Daphnia magna TaxID=35525 RepID=A0ABR0B252_9CRUS|nr:hypothetical protein OUZ56_027639 [Daphnia magna]